MPLNIYEVDERIQEIGKRLAAIEDQLAVLSDKLGVPYEKPSGDVPAEVVELAQSGNRIEAMRRYRELTHTSAEEAREVIARL